MTRPALPGIAVLATAWTLTLAAACGQQPYPDIESDCTAPRFAPPHEHVDPCVGEDVLEAAVATIFRYEPSTQADARTAFGAATPLLSADFVERGESAALVFAPITATTWQQWRAGAVSVATTVRVSRDDHPRDTATTLARVLAVELYPSDSTAMVFSVYAHASRTSSSGGWRLSAMEVSG